MHNNSEGVYNSLRNIVFVIDTLQTGGAERSLLQIAKQLTRYEPVFVQLFNKRNDLKAEFDAAGIKVICLNLSDSYQFRAMAMSTLEVIKALNPALIHATLFKSDMVSRNWARQLGVPLINSFVNNSYSRARYRSEPWGIKVKLWLLQQWDALTAKDVTCFISNSEAIKRTNSSALRVTLNRIKVIYRGRSPQPYESISETERIKLREKMNVNSRKVFLNVSRLIDRKGQLELIQAFALLVKNSNNSVLWIAGEGPFRKTLEEEIRRLSLQDHVHLLGTRNDVPLLLKSADYFVFPSLYEGLPGALIEAMFARTPVIASAIPENKECVNESMALFHTPGKADHLATQMIKALQDPHWQQRTTKAFDYAQQHFEISKVAAQYEKLYDELLSKKQ